MKFAYTDPFFEIDLQKTKINTLVLENTKLYSDFLENMWKQVNGEDRNIHLSIDGKSLRFDKKVELIMNPFAVSCNDRKILNVVYDDLKMLAQDDLIEKITDLNAQIITFLDDVIEKEPYMLTYGLNLDLTGLFKLYGIKVEEEYSDVLDRLVSYIKLSHTVLGKDLFVFYNLKNYMSEQQIKDLHQAAEYEQINLLDIEAHQKNIFNFETITIIDKDYCIININ